MSNISLGKLSQNPQRTAVSYAYCWQDIARIKFAEDKKLVSLHPISEHICEVKYEPIEERAGFAKNVQPGMSVYIVLFALHRSYFLHFSLPQWCTPS